MNKLKSTWSEMTESTRWVPILEISLILIWALWLGRGYLNSTPLSWPYGGEFPLSIQSHYVWDFLRECGLCVTWNSTINGGAPAFIELHGAPLHPVVILTTLIWGASTGGMMTVIIALMVAGIAQWWLAKLLRVGVIPRMWGALLVVAGGHLAGRMDTGLIPAVLATAFTSLMISAGLALAISGRRRAAVILGIVLSLVILSGSGYVQIGMVFAILPAFLVFFFSQELKVNGQWKNFLLAGVLAALLAGVFLVPLVNAFPRMRKDIDPFFGSYQPFEYMPLNLVIRDLPFFWGETLLKQPYPYLYVNFIGWVPILLAIAALRFLRKEQKRLALFFTIGIFMVFFVSSGTFFLLFFKGPLEAVAAQIRNPSLAASLAIPLIVGLASMGLDNLIKSSWPDLSLGWGPNRSLQLPLSWLVLIPVLGWSLGSVALFSQHFYRTNLPPPELKPVTEILKTETAQWVEPPYGEGFWIPYALENGLKVARTFRPWGLEERDYPDPYLIAWREEAEIIPNVIYENFGVQVSQHPENDYAFIESGSGRHICQATSIGGYIDVSCQSNQPGTLIVREHNWPGWKASMDGSRIPLIQDQWLHVEAPSGTHTYEFRYIPMDFILGGFLTVVGVGLSVWIWRRSDPHDKVEPIAGDAYPLPDQEESA